MPLRPWGSLAALGLVLCLPACAAAAVPPRGVAVQTTGRVLIEPSAGAAPYLAAVRGARRSVLVEAYLVTDPGLVQALRAAASRGARVRVIVAGNPYRDASAVPEERREFLGSRVQLRLAPREFEAAYVFDHAKFLVVDAGTAQGLGIVGSSNLDESGLGGEDRDDDYETGSPAVVRALAAVFDADWAGEALQAGAAGPLVLSPGSEPPIAALLDSARRSIDIETEEFGDVPGVMAALESALARKVAVRIVVPSDISAADMRQIETLERLGARAVRLGTPYPHCKLIVVDASVAFLGSENFSTSSLDRNREVGVEVGGSAVPTLESQFAADFAHGR